MVDGMDANRAGVRRQPDRDKLPLPGAMGEVQRSGVEGARGEVQRIPAVSSIASAETGMPPRFEPT